jgi:hypothetical protein
MSGSAGDGVAGAGSGLAAPGPSLPWVFGSRMSGSAGDGVAGAGSTGLAWI